MKIAEQNRKDGRCKESREDFCWRDRQRSFYEDTPFHFHAQHSHLADDGHEYRFFPVQQGRALVVRLHQNFGRLNGRPRPHHQRLGHDVSRAPELLYPRIPLVRIEGCLDADYSLNHHLSATNESGVSAQNMGVVDSLMHPEHFKT